MPGEPAPVLRPAAAYNHHAILPPLDLHLQHASTHERSRLLRGRRSGLGLRHETTPGAGTVTDPTRIPVRLRGPGVPIGFPPTRRLSRCSTAERTFVERLLVSPARSLGRRSRTRGVLAVPVRQDPLGTETVPQGQSLHQVRGRLALHLSVGFVTISK